MALSPNYSWAEPDNSSLVKNGASDIRTLGDAIDTSVWNVGYGQAGKNKIINSDFSINQRSFTTATSDGTYTFDRWVASNTGVSCTYTPQTFTAGAAPVAGYESTNFIRILTTGQTATTERTILVQRIENVRSFAAQTATVSFWAKSATGTPKMAVELSQNFGSGGSASVNNYGGQVTLSTSWARYSATIAVPSISGKTIGTSNFLALNLWVSAGTDFNSRTGSLGIQSNTFDIWGVQVEYGSKATPFQLAGGGDPQSELAMCQRYYYRVTGSNDQGRLTSLGAVPTTSIMDSCMALPVTMRSTISSIEAINLGIYINNTATSYSGGTFTILTGYPTGPTIRYTHTSGLLVLGQVGFIVQIGATAGYLGLSAEL